jgi:hypothetical protein
MLADRHIPSNYEDDELRDFIEQHIEFFSETDELRNPDRMNVAILWPKIEEYVDSWSESKRSDPWEVGRHMVSDLAAAKVEPPVWPRSKKTSQKSKPKSTGGSLADELDDEIPF